MFLLLVGVPLILAVLWRDDLSSTAVRYRLQRGGRSRARGGEPTEAHMVLQVPGMDDIDLGPAPEMGPRVDLGPAIHLAPAPDAGPAAAAPGLVDELERLAGLRDRGALTADEYAAAKRALIGGAER